MKVDGPLRALAIDGKRLRGSARGVRGWNR